MSYLHKEAFAVAEIKKLIEAAGHDDPELIDGMIEGETDFKGQMQRIYNRMCEAEANAAVCATRMDDLQTRKARWETQAGAARKLLQQAMVVAGERKLTLPEATLSFAAARATVIITDETLLPEDCIRMKREPNRAAIKEKLDAKEIVPGACLSNGGENFIIRRS